MTREEKSVLEMAHGSSLERVDYEMTKVMDNILDANTAAAAKRKIAITITFTPDSARKNIGVIFNAKSVLAPTDSLITALYIAGTDSEGAAQAVELTPQMPGQLCLDGSEQDASPQTLKFAR